MLNPTLHVQAIDARDSATRVRDRLLAALPDGQALADAPVAEVIQLAQTVQGLAQVLAELVERTEEHARYHGAHRPDGGRTL